MLHLEKDAYALHTVIGVKVLNTGVRSLNAPAQVTKDFDGHNVIQETT